MKKNKIYKILNKYREASETHDKRFLLLSQRQVANYRKWADLVRSTPVNSPEFRAEVNVLWDESKSLMEQFQEVMLDMAGDTDILVEFFKEVDKEWIK